MPLENVDYLHALCWHEEAGRESSSANKMEMEYKPFSNVDSKIIGLFHRRTNCLIKNGARGGGGTP